MISDTTDNGRFGGSQGNDYSVDVTVLFSNGTTTSFSAAVNWRDTAGSDVRGIGLTRPLNAASDGTGYTPSANYYTSYLLRFVGETVTYSETGLGVKVPEVRGNAATTGLFEALNSYATASPASPTPSSLTSTITANPTTIAANGTSTSTITVQLKDVNENNIATGGHSVTLSSSAGTLGPVTDNGNGTYRATLTSSTNAVTATVTGRLGSYNITDDARVDFTDVQPPTITGPDGNGGTTSGSSAQSSVSENTVSVATFSASENVSWTLSGTDQALFSIDGLGNLRFRNAPDFEYPSDYDANNQYQLNVTATDTAGNAASQTMTVTVTNVSEGQIAGTVLNRQGAAASGVTVRLRSGGAVIATTTTNGSGAYVFSMLAAGTYAVEFVPAAGGNGVKARSNRGNLNGRFLENVTLTADQSITDADAILIDPAGVVYDSASRAPVSGAVVTLTFNNALVPNSWLDQTVGGSNTQTTDADGDYSFVLNGNASSGVYTLNVSPPSGYTFQSSVIAPATGPYNPGLGGGIVSIQPQSTAPSGSDSTTYYLSFNFVIGTTASTTSNGVVNNHIPIDPNASVATSTITASPTSITADGTTTSTITVQLKDASGNSVTTGGATVALSTSLGTLGSVTDNGNGTYTATLTSAITAGTATISGTLGGATITDTATVTMTVGAASVATSTITASPTSITANGTTTSTITVQLKDASGNNVTTGGATVALSTSLGTLGSVTDNGDGTYTATLTSAVTAGIATISGTLGGATITDTATVAMTVGAASVATSTITASPTSITADGTTTSTITVQLKDASGNNVTTGGATVALSTSLGTLGSVTDNGDGTYTATLTSAITAGTATISGTLGGAAITDTATVTMTVGAASVATSTITASPTSITANGTTTSTITVQLKDASGNNLTTGGATVALSTSLGTLGSVTDNGNGTYTATLTSALTAGTATISGTLGGAAITDTATVTMTVGAASVATSTITASPTSITADSTSTSTITLQLKDASGNNVTTGGATVALSTSLGTMGSVTDNNNGTYTATLTSAITAGTATISGTLGGAAITDTATVTFVLGNSVPVANAGADQTVTSASTVTLDGRASADANGDPLTYAWTQTSGTSVTLSSATAAQPTFSAPALNPGDADTTLVFSLTVSDGTSTSAADTVTITVQAAARTPAAELAANAATVRQTLQDDAIRSIRSVNEANRLMVQSARDRLVANAQRNLACGTDTTDRRLGFDDRYDLCDQDHEWRDEVPFDLGGAASLSEGALSIDGTFSGNWGEADGKSRRLLFGDFNLQRDGVSGSSTATLTARLAWERSLSTARVLGYFVGLDVAHSGIEEEFAGDQDRVAVEAGGYAVHQLAENLYLDGYVTVGAGRNNLAMASDTLELASEYTTRTATVGAAISGVYEYARYDFQPELAISAGRTWIGDVGFTGQAFGASDDGLGLDVGSVSIATIMFRPEVVWALDAERVALSTSRLSFAPRIFCERAKTDRTVNECGEGAEVTLDGLSEDGLTKLDLGVAVDRVGQEERAIYTINLLHRF